MQSNVVRALFAASAVGFLALAQAGQAAPANPFIATVFATGADVSATQPDSITVGGGHVFIEYGNGSNSSAPLGTGGASTIAEYDLSGNLTDSFSVLGSADGVRYNPTTNLLWVLQNQDGNSALTTIDPSTDTKTKYTYTNPSASRGFDDVAFVGGKAYLSYSNPVNNGDPIIYSATLGGGKVTLGSAVLSYGDAGTNPGGNSVVNDPDSLDLTPNGSLLLTSGDDASLTTVSNPGTASQSVKSVSLINGYGGHLSGLDDVVFAGTAAQDLLVADTANNIVYRVSGPFQAGTAYASVGSLNSVDSVDLNNGPVTSITDGLFAANASPHGLGFIPAAAVPEASTTVSFALLLAFGLGGLVISAKKKNAKA